MLKYEVPVVFQIITNICPGEYAIPTPELIRMVCRSSRDPSLKKAKFYRYLDDYAAVGVYCKRAKVYTPQRDAYYACIRRRKMERFIKANKEQGELKNLRHKI